MSRSTLLMLSAFGLHAERVSERLPAANLVAEEPQRGPHMPLLLAVELHDSTKVVSRSTVVEAMVTEPRSI